MADFLLILLFAVAPADPAAPTVKLLDGRTVTGAIAEWSSKRLAIETSEGRQEFAAGELHEVRWPDAPVDPLADALTTQIELVDGTRIPIAEFTVTDRVARVVSPFSGQPLIIDVNLIKFVELQQPSDASRAAWDALADKDVAGDLLLVTNREGKSVDHLAGVVGDVTAEQVSFKWDGETVPVKRSKVVGVAFFTNDRAKLPEAVCRVTLADGSIAVVSNVSQRDDGAIVLKTPAGAELSIALDQLRHIDFSAGKLVYLSDLTPTESEWTPRIALPPGAQLLGAYGQPRGDQSFAGSPISILWKNDSIPSRRDERTYSKGLALRSRTEVTYRLPDGMRRFSTIAGIDPATASQGHVTLEVRGDDRVLWEGEISGRRPPAEIDVELGSARRLQLRVDYGENLDYGDRLHLAEARLTK